MPAADPKMSAPPCAALAGVAGVRGTPMEKRRQQREEDARLAEEQEEQTGMRLGGGRLQKLEQLAAPTDGTQVRTPFGFKSCG